MQKTICITGATSGIGKACAEAFAQENHNLILTGRRANLLNNLKNYLETTYSIKVVTLCFDVQNKQETFNAIQTLQGSIDVLINNAGLALGRDNFENANMDHWDTMINTNLKGLLYASRACLPYLLKSTEAHIVNIGSTAAKEVYENGNVYCATKAAVEAISKSMRIDLLKHGVKVTCVHPGAVDTEFSLVRFEGDKEKAAKVYQGFTPLYASDVALVIKQIINLPNNICLNDVVLTCKAQANSMYLHK
jgi:3-hydroxy acid dehydrogenase / malonic semialdehyde reductase